MQECRGARARPARGVAAAEPVAAGRPPAAGQHSLSTSPRPPPHSLHCLAVGVSTVVYLMRRDVRAGTVQLRRNVRVIREAVEEEVAAAKARSAGGGGAPPQVPPPQPPPGQGGAAPPKPPASSA